MVELIRKCENCDFYRDPKINGFCTGYHCLKSQSLPDCSFEHFFTTWTKGMQQDALEVLANGEKIDGLRI